MTSDTSAHMNMGGSSSSKARKLPEVLKEEFTKLHPRCDAGDGTLEALYEKIHELPDPQSALCLSGGGIRSASFALGVLQALARHGLLMKFTYLSTVSGGGYVGSWLSAWRRYTANDEAIVRALARRQVDPPEEVAQLRGLRAYSSYLTPRRGILSADTWTAVALYLRNLLLNWIVFLPLFLAVVVVPIGSDRFLSWAQSWPPLLPWQKATSLGFVAVALVFGLAFSLAGAPGYPGRGPDSRGIGQRNFLRTVLLAVYFAATGLAVVCIKVARLFGSRALLLWAGPLAGLAIYLPAWLLALFLPCVTRRLHLGYFIKRGPSLDRGRFPYSLSAWVTAGAVAGFLIALGCWLWAWLPPPDWCNGLLVAQSGSGGLIACPPLWDWRNDLLVAVGVAWVMLALNIAETVYVGLTNWAPYGDAEREWRGRSSGWLAVAALIWMIWSGAVLFLPEWTKSSLHWLYFLAGGTVSGLLAALLGSSAKTAATAALRVVEKLKLSQIVSLATVIFLLLLAILLSALAHLALRGFEGWLGWGDSAGLRLLATAIAAVLLVLFALGASLFVNVNRFSLHAVYRNRLIRAFLGSARCPEKRHPDRFTGFDRADDLPMAKLWPPKSEHEEPHLFPVINMTLNVVATQRLAWQERKAESFVVTPLASGNTRVGFRKTCCYGGSQGGITLGTAMAISGASVSPNQGYYSSPLVGLLMMLFNVRLGWWLGNPKKETTAPRDGPQVAILWFIAEMFGWTTDNSGYVYLSDGGHFENLGLYEMVRRRCSVIVVSDADCDPQCTFEDLGNAVRKIWIDLGVEIRFRGIDIRPRQKEPTDGVYCAIADIFYPEKGAKRGTLLYIKPAYYGNEPPDIRSYAETHKDFPHDPTTDQWFGESHMESYRSLGSTIVDLICARGIGVRRDDEGLGLDEFIRRAEAYLAAYARGRRAGLAPAT